MRENWTADGAGGSAELEMFSVIAAATGLSTPSLPAFEHSKSKRDE